MQIKDLKQDHRNYRKHNERNLDLIKKSINEVGLGRSIVIDSENEIVCGNGLVSQLDKNTPVKVIETDGSELVVVKRTDLNTDDEKRKKLAVMDNSTSDSSEFDLDLISEDFTNGELLDMGTYVKSFYSVIACPSCVKIGVMGSVDYRIHHNVNWNLAVPKIIREVFKK